MGVSIVVTQFSFAFREMVSGSPIIAAFERASQLRAQRTTSSTNPPASSSTQRITPTTSVPSAQIQEDLIQVEDSSKNTKRKHSLHHVLPIETKRTIAHWMCFEFSVNVDKLIVSKTVPQFPQFFKSSHCANHMRAKRLWEDRASLTQGSSRNDGRRSPSSITRVTTQGVQRCRLKAKHRHGRKRSAWVEDLHDDLRS